MCNIFTHFYHSDSDRAESPGLSPPASPSRRQFKRRRRSSRSPRSVSSSSDGDVAEPPSAVLSDNSPDRKDATPIKPVAPRSMTSEEASLVMIQRFCGMVGTSLCDFTPPIKQLSCPQSIEALTLYIAHGASLSLPILMVMEKLLSKGEFSDVMLAAFPSVLSSALDARKHLKIEDDETDAKLLNVAAKWLNLFIANASANHYFTIEGWLTCGTELQMLAAARTVPYLLSDPAIWQLADTALGILSEHDDDHTFRALIAIDKELDGRLSVSSSPPDPAVIPEGHPDEKVTLICSNGPIDIFKSHITAISPVFNAMFNHINSNSFTEAANPDEIQLKNVNSSSINIILKLASRQTSEHDDQIVGEAGCNKLDDWFDVDDFCQQYLVLSQLRNRVQRALWPRLKCFFLKCPGQVLDKIVLDIDGAAELFCWPLSIYHTLCEYEHRHFFRTTFNHSSISIISLARYLCSKAH